MNYEYVGIVKNVKKGSFLLPCLEIQIENWRELIIQVPYIWNEENQSYYPPKTVPEIGDNCLFTKRNSFSNMYDCTIIE